MSDAQFFKNITQVCTFPVCWFLPYEIPTEIFDDIKQAVSTLKDEALATALHEIHERLPLKLKELLMVFGVKLPTDNIRGYITLGSYLFDMYLNNHKVEETPIGQARFEKRKTELGAMLDTEEDISLPKWALAPIMNNMNNTENYASCNFTIMFDVNGEKKSCKINKVGMAHFKMIEQSAADMMIELCGLDQ